MPSLMAATTTVTSDEPAYLLFEGNEHIQFTNETHRIQKVIIVRNDQLVEWRDDLGMASRFPHAHPVCLLGGEVGENGHGRVFETVGTMRDEATRIRNQTKADWDELWGFDQDVHRDWETEYHEERERRARTHKTFATGK